MNDEPKDTPTALTLNPALSGWDGLHELDRLSWLRRAEGAIKYLQPVFAPKAVHLKYEGPYRAALNLLGENSVTECGTINLFEPEN